VDEAEFCPWDEPGQVRRDAEPHRGHLLWTLGTASVTLGVLSAFLVVPGLVGLPLGVVAMVTARQDLEQMDAGRMDPGGIALTDRAEDLASCGVVVNVVAPLLLPGLMLLLWLYIP
jgi:hypothetical protein